MSKQDMTEAIERTRAVLRAALILSEPEQETSFPRADSHIATSYGKPIAEQLTKNGSDKARIIVGFFS